jgi:hypothetical protein
MEFLQSVKVDLPGLMLFALSTNGVTFLEHPVYDEDQGVSVVDEAGNHKTTDKRIPDNAGSCVVPDRNGNMVHRC